MNASDVRAIIAALHLVTLIATTGLAQTTQQKAPADAGATIALKWGQASERPNINVLFTNALPSILYSSAQAPGRVSVLVTVTSPVARVGEVDCFITLDSRRGSLAPQLLSMGPAAALGNAETGSVPVYSTDAIPVAIAIYAVSQTESGAARRAQRLSNVLRGTLQRDNNYLNFFTQHPQRTEYLSFDSRD